MGSLPYNICEAVVIYNPDITEQKARDILTYEKEIISKINENSTNVEILYNQEKVCNDLYRVRRALAFCDDDIDNARALLLAELEEEEEEEDREENVKESSTPPPPATVLPAISVSSNIDPTKI